MNETTFKRRILIISGFVVIGALIFFIKLVYIQLIHGETYSQLADRQYVTNPSLIFNRGSILFTQKDGDLVSLAATKSGFKIAMNPRTLENKEDAYEKLASLVTISRDRFYELAGKGNAYQEIALFIDEETASKVTELNIPGIAVYRMNWRWYPADTLASHTIGFMAYKGDDFMGRYGLERSYEEVLKRTDTGVYVNFFAEVFADVGKLLKEAGDTEGDIVTTMDPLVQQNLETTVQSIQQAWNSNRVGGIIMNPKTGAIYAMALDNGFNLNTREVVDVAQFNNPLVENVFEMGSTMKPIIAAMGIDQGAFTPQTTYFDQGSLKVGDKTVSNFDHRGRGLVTIQDILNQSLNTGAVFMQQQMDKKKFRDGWLAFGFGQKTGIDLPGEVAGLVSNVDSLRPVELANISFGQGVAITPIGMTRALAVLANGGDLVTPHLVSEVRYLSGISRKIEYPVTKNIIKPETSKMITDMLVKVYDHYGEGSYKMEHYSIAAKTGTAQVADRGNGGYFENRYVHSFFGYLPASDPQFLVFLYNDYPKGADYSSQTLLPPFVDLSKFLVNYYNIAPDR